MDRGSQAIRIGLRAYGVDVEVIGRPVDLLCGFRGKTFLIECKAPGARPRKDQPKQDLFIRTWRGQVAKVSTLEEALQVVGVVR